jgi:hypothetical protein
VIVLAVWGCTPQPRVADPVAVGEPSAAPLVRADTPFTAPVPSPEGHWAVERLTSDLPLHQEAGIMAYVLALSTYDVSDDELTVHFDQLNVTHRLRRQARSTKRWLVGDGTKGLVDGAVLERSGETLMLEAMGMTMTLRRVPDSATLPNPELCAPDMILDAHTTCRSTRRDELRAAIAPTR